MKLTKGPGSPGKGGCWMVAVQQYTEPTMTHKKTIKLLDGTKMEAVVFRDNAWHDHPECVHPVIREFCIWMNDNCPDEERESIIGPHLFDPVGTADIPGGLIMSYMEDFVMERCTPEHAEVIKKFHLHLFDPSDVLRAIALITEGYKVDKNWEGSGRIVVFPNRRTIDTVMELIVGLCGLAGKKEVTPAITQEEVKERLSCES